ncbi:MAG: hypothetical protein SPL48_06860, partial [Bacteroidales bacterium]|nr:hypothetical protein [Bacteroidales bacterium]
MSFTTFSCKTHANFVLKKSMAPPLWLRCEPARSGASDGLKRVRGLFNDHFFLAVDDVEAGL